MFFSRFWLYDWVDRRVYGDNIRPKQTIPLLWRNAEDGKYRMLSKSLQRDLDKAETLLSKIPSQIIGDTPVKKLFTQVKAFKTKMDAVPFPERKEKEKTLGEAKREKEQVLRAKYGNKMSAIDWDGSQYTAWGKTVKVDVKTLEEKRNGLIQSVKGKYDKAKAEVEKRTGIYNRLQAFLVEKAVVSMRLLAVFEGEDPKNAREILTATKPVFNNMNMMPDLMEGYQNDMNKAFGFRRVLEFENITIREYNTRKRKETQDALNELDKMESDWKGLPLASYANECANLYASKDIDGMVKKARAMCNWIGHVKKKDFSDFWDVKAQWQESLAVMEGEEFRELTDKIAEAEKSNASGSVLEKGDVSPEIITPKDIRKREAGKIVDSLGVDIGEFDAVIRKISDLAFRFDGWKPDDVFAQYAETTGRTRSAVMEMAKEKGRILSLTPKEYIQAITAKARETKASRSLKGVMEGMRITGITPAQLAKAWGVKDEKDLAQRITGVEEAKEKRREKERAKYSQRNEPYLRIATAESLNELDRLEKEGGDSALIEARRQYLIEREKPAFTANIQIAEKGGMGDYLSLNPWQAWLKRQRGEMPAITEKDIRHLTQEANNAFHAVMRTPYYIGFIKAWNKVDYARRHSSLSGENGQIFRRYHNAERRLYNALKWVKKVGYNVGVENAIFVKKPVRIDIAGGILKEEQNDLHKGSSTSGDITYQELLNVLMYGFYYGDWIEYYIKTFITGELKERADEIIKEMMLDKNGEAFNEELDELLRADFREKVINGQLSIPFNAESRYFKRKAKENAKRGIKNTRERPQALWTPTYLTGDLTDHIHFWIAGVV